MNILFSKSRNLAMPALALVLGILAGRSSLPREKASEDPPNIRSGSAATGQPSHGNPDQENYKNTEPKGEGVAHLKGALARGSRVGRLQAILAMTDRLGSDGFTRLLGDMQQSGWDVAYRNEYLLVLSAWAERDPLAAATHVHEMDGESDLKSAVMAAWSAIDPESAERWARNMADAGTANPWLVGVIEGIAAADVERARSLIEDIPRGRELNRALDATLGHVYLHGSQAAAEWINGIDDEHIQQNSAEWLAERMAIRDPEAVTAWISSLENVDAQRKAAEELAGRYASQNLIAAKSWVATLPEEARVKAAEGVVDHLARQDPAAAFHWSTELGGGPELDGVRRDIVRRGFERDPAAALTIALHLEDHRDRERFTARYLQRWIETDPAAASGWLNDNARHLPEATRSALNELE